MGEVFYQASYPRSGSTLTRILLDHHFDINTRTVYGADGISTTKSKNRTVLRIQEIREGSDFVALKTHQASAMVGLARALMTIRDGRDAIISFARYLLCYRKETMAFDRLLRRIALGRYQTPMVPGVLAGKWLEFHEYWLDKHPGPISILRFEDLAGTNDKLSVILPALRKLYPDIEPVRTDPPPSFEDLHRDNPDFFRRGEVGSWRDEMPERIEREFWQVNGAMMERLGYER